MAVHRGSLFFSSLMMPRVGEWKGVWKGAGSIRILKKIRKSRLTNGTALANWGSWSHAPHQHKGLCFSLTHCSSLSVRIHNSVQLFSLPLPSCLSSLLGNKCKAQLHKPLEGKVEREKSMSRSMNLQVLSHGKTKSNLPRENDSGILILFFTCKVVAS